MELPYFYFLLAFVPGSGGNGKSTAMKYLAMTWADRSHDELNAIDFMFHISLNKVQTNHRIEQIIVDQHPGLKDKDVQPSDIKWILQKCVNKRTVVLLDGYDEYSPGTNFYIDNMITKRHLRNCGIILEKRNPFTK